MNFITILLIVLIFVFFFLKFSCLPNLFLNDSYDLNREPSTSSKTSDILPPYTPPSLSRSSRINDNIQASVEISNNPPPSYEISINTNSTIEIPPPSYADSSHRQHIEDTVRE